MNLRELRNNIIVKNFFFLGLGNGISQLLGMVAIMLITQILLPAEYGIYSFMLIQAQLIAAVSELGMRNIIIRNVARSESEKLKIFSTSSVNIILANVVFFLAYSIYNYSFGSFTSTQLYVIGFYSIAFCFSGICESLFMGLQKMSLISFWSIFFAIGWLLFVLIYPKERITVTLLFGVSTLLLTARALVYIILLRYKGFILFFSVRKEDIYMLIKESSPYFGLVLVALPANYLSVNFLEINSTNDQIGFFTLAQKIVAPIMMVSSVLFSVLFPNLSILWKKNRESFYKMQNKGVALFVIGIALISFLFSIFFEYCFLFFFDENFSPSIIIGKLMVWHIALLGFSSLIGTIWGAMNKEKLAFKMAALNAAINIPMLWIGSKYGGIGLAISYVVTFFIFAIILWCVFYKNNRLKRSINYCWLFWITLFLLSFIV